MATIELARRSLIDPVVAPYVEADAADDDERERYRRDPFAHLEEMERWTDAEGVERVGHIIVPQIETGEDGPLDPFHHQREFVAAWIDLPLLKETGTLRFRNVHVEKSRQMGMTWFLAYLVWWLLTYHDVRGGYSNMVAEEVDDGGDASSDASFFGKIRYIHDRVPSRFRARLVFKGGNRPSIRRRGGSAYVIGRGAVASPGRGGTFHFWIVDEAARFPYGEAAHSALGRACPVGRVYNSTPFGESNVYFRAKAEQWQDWQYVAFHWSEHPLYGFGAHVAAVAPDVETGEPGYMAEQETPEAERWAAECPLCKGTMAGIEWTSNNTASHRYPGKLTSPWYDAAVVEFTDEQVASELDIDYAGALPARVYVEFDERVHVVDSIPYSPSLGIEFAFDYGLDTTAVAILQDGPGEIVQIGEVEIADASPDEVSGAIVATLRALGVPDRELEPQWLARMFAVGDPAGDYREVGTARSIASKYADNHFNITSPGKPWPVATTILTTKRILRGRPKRYRVSAATCPQTIRHWKLNRWPVDRDGNRKPGATAPLDDENNHMCFTAGTLVATADGPTPIERVRVGTPVWTRDGWKPVVAAGPTGLRRVVRVRFDGGEIVGTPEHPVWIVDEGWRRLDEVGASASDALLVMPEIPDRDVALIAEQTAYDARRGVVVDVQAARSRAVSTSARGLTADRAETSLRRSESVVLAGRHPVLDSQPIGAVAVAPLGVLPSAAPGAGGASSGILLPSGVVRAFDRDAAVLAVPGSTSLEHAAILDVDSDSTDRVVVYNLSVGGTPEFFANGALVHNCRALAYYLTYKYPAPDVGEALDDALVMARLAQREGQFTEARYGMKF